jgi:methylenetetrahydrofolate--tRNA-(uracil-5-)-methyltransferase
VKSNPDLLVIGGGLAGSEAAWQAAQRGIETHLYEMRPSVSTGAHQTADLAELICSNSLGSLLPDRASGILANELRLLGSLLFDCAEHAALPAGSALAVDRGLFSRLVTEKIQAHPRITLVRQELTGIPDRPTIIASGPLTSTALSLAIAGLTGKAHLHFFDAIAPIVTLSSINMEIAFRASRFGRGQQMEGDYINCPFTKQEYENFISALISAQRIPLKGYETDIEAGVNAGNPRYFEGCLPVEVLARRGPRSLAFGTMRPIGLRDPRTSLGPYAIVQLRQDNLAGDLYNLVGFQTNLTYPEQKRVFHMIPGLENADFVRFGQMHRNTFLASPALLQPTLQYSDRPNLFFAGQITGVEGYLGNIASGALAGINAARLLSNEPLLTLPADTMLGALCHYITHADLETFQPMKANLGILPSLSATQRLGKLERAGLYAARAEQSLKTYLHANRVSDENLA